MVYQIPSKHHETHVLRYLNCVGSRRMVHGIDLSAEMIYYVCNAVREIIGKDYTEKKHGTVRFGTVDLYRSDHSVCPSLSYDMVKEDRVMQHLEQSLEPLHDIVRMVKPGGTLLLYNPDFCSFAIDATDPSHQGIQMRQPPLLNFDLVRRTDKILGGVVPTLYHHMSMGLAQPGLMRKMEMGEIEVGVFILVLVGQKEIKAVVPIGDMERLSRRNRMVSKDEV